MAFILVQYLNGMENKEPRISNSNCMVLFGIGLLMGLFPLKNASPKKLSRR
jgi:hypothetical protein